MRGWSPLVAVRKSPWFCEFREFRILRAPAKFVRSFPSGGILGFQGRIRGEDRAEFYVKRASNEVSVALSPKKSRGRRCWERFLKQLGTNTFHAEENAVATGQPNSQTLSGGPQEELRAPRQAKSALRRAQGKQFRISKSETSSKSQIRNPKLLKAGSTCRSWRSNA